MTLAELHVGVLIARDDETRETRLDTLCVIEREFDPLPVDDDVRRQFASIVAEARRRGSKPQVIDALIAATAATHRMPLYTQDSDFVAFRGPEVVLV